MNIIKIIKLHRKLRIEEEILILSRIDYMKLGFTFDSFPLSNILQSIEKVIDKIEYKFSFLSNPNIYKIVKISNIAKHEFSKMKLSDIVDGKWTISIKINTWHFFSRKYAW